MSTGAIVGKVATSAMRALLAKLPTEQEKIDRVRDEIYRDAVLEIEAALQRFVERYEREGVTAEQLAGKIDERATTVLFLQLFEQAVKSATRDRLRLMASAVAGTFVPGLDVETKSRATRALTQLEASDVVLLRLLAADGGHWASARNGLPWAKDRLQPLVTTGCVFLETGAIAIHSLVSFELEVRICESGRAVLAMVEDFSDE